ncbi:hypothetical protein Tco_0017798 [Tanacetum coccineum]
MADLIFVDSHNMVAYLEKSEDNANFAEIVDFLNASPIRYALTVSLTVYVSYIEQFWSTTKIKTINNETQICAKVDGKTIVITKSSVRRDLHFNDEDATKPQHTPTTASPSHEEPIPTIASSSQPKKTQKHRKTKRKATEISQSSGPTTLVADETVHEERGDSVERATTTATSLDAEQGSGGNLRRQDTMGDRPAQTRVLDLENVKNAQALEIQKLKKRVKKLESKKKSRTPQLNRRLFKVRIESSAEKSLGDQEDASKQGRNEIDQDEGISWFQEDSETQGRYDHDIGVNTASTPITIASINITTTEPVTTTSAPVTIVGVSITTAKPSTPLTTTTTTTPIEDEDLTIAQTFMKMKIPLPQIDPKDKGKAKMVEHEKPKKKKDQIEFDADVAQRLQAELDEEARLKREREEEASKAANIAEWDDVQAMMDSDYDLATKLQEQEREDLTIK